MTVHGGPKIVSNNLVSCSDPASRNSYYPGDDNVSLLLNFDGPNGSRDFVDSSKYNHVITANGDVKISTAQSKFGGASAAFDGAGDYLSVSVDSSLELGTGNFTLEAWVFSNVSLTGSSRVIFDARPVSATQTGNPVFFVSNSGYLYLASGNAATGDVAVVGSTVLSANTWYHVVACRNGNTCLLFINGVQDASADVTGAIYNSIEFNIGFKSLAGSSMTYWDGYIDGLRITKGVALFTSNFTPPTAPFKSSNIVYNLTPNVESSNDNVSLLLNFDGPNGSTNFVDSSNYNHTITANGNAQISTAQSKFGGSSAYFDGTGDYLSLAANSGLEFGTGDFTIEFWVMMNSTASLQLFFEPRTEANQVTPVIYMAAGGGVRFYVSGADRITGAGISTSQWYHISVSRSSGQTRMFINGTQTGSTYADTNDYISVNTRIGIGWDNFSSLNGYIDDLIITKGVAKYTNNFQVPSSPATLVPMESLRLRFDGENGSTTFRDLSPYNHTITANGNAQISTAVSKFGGASAAFDGSGDYLSIASSPEFGLGTGDFTFETWIYKTKSGNCAVFHGTTTGLIININTSEQVVVRLFGVADRLTSSQGLSLNQWNHVAVARAGGTMSIWINGSRSSGGTIANSDNFAQTGFNIAANDSNIAIYGGYLSDLRLVKGIAVYDPNTATFTPPTAPAEPYLSASLLLNFDGTNGSTAFTDESPYAHTITANGNAQISTAKSKFGGSSAYFDGTGDWITGPISNEFVFGTGAFTVECWIYWDGTITGTPYMGVLGVHNSTGTGRYAIFMNSSGIGHFIQTAFPGMSAFSANQWTHIASTRDDAGVCRFFIDGVVKTTVTDAGNLTAPQGFRVGNEFSTGRPPFSGYIDSLRIVKGRALYTGNFTPPQKQQKLITNKDVRNISLYDDVSLQLNFDGANGSTTFVDSSFNNHTVTANGNAQISTAQSKFGGSSAAFDGSGDYLDSESSSQFAFGTGDFTVEFWLFPTSSSVTYRCIVDTRSTVITNTGVGIFQYGLTLQLYGNGLKLSSAANALTLNEWQHVVLARESGACQFYINGVASGSSATYSDDLTGQSVRMGVNKNGNNPYTGYIDDLRITKGRALYTKNFTPPTRALRNSTIYESSNKGIISCDHNNYLEIEQILDPTTIDFWFKTFNTDDAAIIYAGDDTYDSTQWQWALYYYNDTLYYQPSSQSSEYIEISPLSMDTWYNIVLTRGSSGKVYINGVLVDSNSCSDSLVAGHTRIGKSGNNYWNGNLSQLKMYDDELSSSEVRDNFNALKGRFGL